jgi:hypothetical protein
LPTPTVPRGGGERSGDRAGTGDLVFMARRGLWPTPHGICAPGPRRPGPSGNELGRAVNEAECKMWPTPKASASGPDYARMARPDSGGDDLATAAARTEGGGSLNPAWVEWLMGFPPGWTDLEASETASSRRSPNGSAAGSSSTSGDES